ncbi:MAG: alpha/beta fold hydrolase, partial [Chlorobi bacterium]|nr:alpha/beta fold hydrolase [Chlorobiota bacterium]
MITRFSFLILRCCFIGTLLLATGPARYCVAQQQSPARYNATSPDNPGPFNAGFRNVTLTRGSRTLACVIYYPATSAGQNKPLDYSGRPYPMVAFGHGFGMQKSYYTSFYRHFASWGYIVIAPQFPDYQNKEMAYDLLYCLQYLRDQHGTTGSFLYASVDTAHPGLTGHSMGGGASLLAASYDSRILAVAPMAAAETSPSAIAAMPKIQGAVCLVAASKDGITPPSTNQQPMYNAAHAFKSLPLFQGANHTRFMDYAGWDWTDPNGNMTRAEQQRLSRKYITAVFNLFLKRDPDYWTYVYGTKAKSEPKVSLSFETKYEPPFDFRLISPLHGTVTVSIDLLWHRALTLNPSDTVKYIVQISRNTAFSPVEFRVETY